jgi:hypothetical protein
MKILATRIAKELKSASHCGVYEPELARVWPDSETAKPKSRYLPKSTAGDSATISTGSAQFLIKSLPQKTRNYENSRWTNQTRIATAGR